MHSRNLSLYLTARFLSACPYQILMLVLSKMIHLETRNPLDLGYLGLFSFLPNLIFGIPGGYMADRFKKQNLVTLYRILKAAVMVGIVLSLTAWHHPLWVLYGYLAILGILNALDGPANQSFLLQIVPVTELKMAITWNASLLQLGMVSGPLIGGLLLTVLPAASILALISVLFLTSGLLIALIRANVSTQEESTAVAISTVFSGMRYVWSRPVLLGAMSLDLFAVLLGGAVALMPFFADEILQGGNFELGLLSAAPAMGAVVMSFALRFLPPFKKAGKTLFFGIAVFGLATIGFGLSRHLILSVFFLIVLGAADMISVVIRNLLIQLKAPAHMRGRVMAVNHLFVGASNDLGKFESGITANLFGIVPAVVIGGVGTVLIASLWYRLFPDLGRMDKLED